MANNWVHAVLHQRSDFFQRQMAHSPTGNFSFYAGDKPVIGMSGDEPRRLFFESKHLGFTEGYGALLGGSPTVNKKNNNPLAEPESQSDGFGSYFQKRLTAMLKGPILARGLPQLLDDVRTSVRDLAAKETKTIDPFDDIYRLVFQVTMRTVACIEIASDHEMLRKVLGLFETIEYGNTTFHHVQLDSLAISVASHICRRETVHDFQEYHRQACAGGQEGG